MVFHMKTTLNIDEGVMAKLKQEAARRRKTMSELVETALRRLLEASPENRELPPLPSFDSGGHRVDVSGDGFADWLAHFPTADAGLVPGDVEACVSGELTDGTLIEGCDAILTVGR